MLRFLKRHRETLLITLLGLVIFGALNWMMVGVDPDRYTNPRLGSWSAFKNLHVSGFDFYTYSIISDWNPRYALFKHPLLAVMVWPLSELNKWLKDITGINCAIYIVGVLWTVLSTVSWLLLYKIIRKMVGLPWVSSLIYTLLFFSFSHVMIITFFPDHMGWTLCILLFTVYTMTKAKGAMPIWKTLLLYFVGTGISTTNGIKIWLMDMVGSWFKVQGSRFKCCFRRSLHFLIPTAILFGCYVLQENTTQEDFRRDGRRMAAIQKRKDTIQTRQSEAKKALEAKAYERRTAHQIGSSEYFSFTDTSIDRWPLLYENVFGEGLLLHDTHVLEDANGTEHPRPVFVKYSSWIYYVINGVIVMLCALGLWCGRRKKIMWMVLLPFLFDMFLHVGIRFASADVYIMTAHWAFILPIGIALLEKTFCDRKIYSWALLGLVGMIAAFLWIHNLTLTVEHMALF